MKFLFSKLRIFALLVLTISPLAALVPEGVSAAACTSSTYGTVTLSGINVPQAGTYKIWARMQAPDSTNNSFNLEIDGNTCIKIGNSSVTPVNNWVWVDWRDGNTSSKITHTFNSANGHTFKLFGIEPGVKVDRIILVDPSSPCIPSNTRTSTSEPGDNCSQSTPITPPAPTITMSSSADAVQTGGSVTLNWTISPSGSASSCSISPIGFSFSPTTTTGTRSVGNLTSTTTYTMSCSGPGGQSNTAQKTITVTQSPPAPQKPAITSFTEANGKTSVKKGEKAKLQWASSNSTTCRISYGTSQVSVAATGSWDTIALNDPITFGLICANEEGTNSTPLYVTLQIETASGTTSSTPQLPAITPISENDASKAKERTVTSTTGQLVTVAPNNTEISGLTVIDPTNVTDSEKQKNIKKVEYYANGRLVTTVEGPPFALDTTLLENGRYNIVERTHFADGSVLEASTDVSVDNPVKATNAISRFYKTNSPAFKTIGIILGVIALGIGGFFAFRHFNIKRLYWKNRGF